MAKQKGAAASVQPVGVKSGRFQKLKREFKRDRQLWIVSILALAFMIVFYLLPMLGNYMAFIMAFIDYKVRKGFFGSEFVGLKYFKQFFSLPDVWLVIRNTLVMGGLNITIGFVASIILALMLNELRFKTMKRVLQTVSYLPHFVSWVVVASLAMSLFSTDGIVNEVLINMGLLEEPVNIVTKGDTYWIFITALNIWKTMGWSSIIYMSAMAGIDQELYQAGAVDGLGRWGMVWHITIPGISSTIIMLFILGVGGIINGGFEQHLLLGSATTREFYETIDTYVYRYGLEMGQYSFGTAVGLFKVLIAVVLLVITNWISRRFSDTAVF